MTKLPRADQPKELSEWTLKQLAEEDEALDRNPNAPPIQALMLEQFRSPRRWRELARLVHNGLLDHAPVPHRRGYGRNRPSPLDVIVYDARRITALWRSGNIKPARGGLTAIDAALERSLRIASMNVSEEDREALVHMVSWRIEHRSGPTGAQRHRTKKSRAKT